MYSYTNWTIFVSEHLNGSTAIGDSDAIIVMDKNYLLHLNDVMGSTSRRTIANYFGISLLVYN